MNAYILRRLLVAPLILLLLATASFAMMRAAKGGPFDGERKLDPQVEQALRARYRLDQPLWEQYLRFLGDCARGDLGPSFKQRAMTVNEIIAAKLPVSLYLGAISLLLALAGGLAAGVMAAVRHGQAADRLATAGALAALSVPTFVVGPLLALVFGLWLGWLPVAGWQGPWAAAHLLLPALTLALPFAARIARLSRAGLLEVLGADHIRTARAKGQHEAAVVLRHALRPGLVPVVGFLGPATAAILTGSLVIEQIFQIPGLGTEFVTAALNRDYTLVMGTVLTYGALLVLCNLAADLLLAWLDPRVRLS